MRTGPLRALIPELSELNPGQHPAGIDVNLSPERNEAVELAA